MGLSSKKTKSTTQQDTSFSQTPVNQPYVNDALQGLTGRVMDLSKIDPQSLVAGADPLQTQGAGLAGTLGGPNANFGQAATYFNQAGNGGAAAYDPAMSGGGTTASPFISKYMSPYLKDVVDTSLADYDFGAGHTRAANQLSLAGDSTFGGSGGAIQTSMSNDAIDRGRGALSAQLRDQGFTTALGAAQSDAERAQQSRLADMAAKNTAWSSNATAQDNNLQRMLAAGQGLTGLGTAQDANTRDNATTQANIGSILQQIAQTKAASPLALLSAQTGLFGSLPLDLQHGTSGTGSMTGTSTGKESGATLGDWLQFFGSNAKAAAGGGG